MKQKFLRAHLAVAHEYAKLSSARRLQVGAISAANSAWAAKSLGLSEGPGFLNYVNTNKSPTHGKNIGWLFFEGKEKIEDLLKNIKKEDICYYE